MYIEVCTDSSIRQIFSVPEIVYFTNYYWASYTIRLIFAASLAKSSTITLLLRCDFFSRIFRFFSVAFQSREGNTLWAIICAGNEHRQSVNNSRDESIFECFSWFEPYFIFMCRVCIVACARWIVATTNGIVSSELGDSDNLRTFIIYFDSKNWRWNTNGVQYNKMEINCFSDNFIGCEHFIVTFRFSIQFWIEIRIDKSNCRE